MLTDQLTPDKRTYRIESMDSDTDRVVSSLNLEEMINNYNTWNQLTVGKALSSTTYLNVNCSHSIGIYLNVCKQWLMFNCYYYIETLVII